MPRAKYRLPGTSTPGLSTLGCVSVNAVDVFSGEQVERARRYHRPLYFALAFDLVFGIGVLVVLAFSRVGDAAFRLVDGGPWWLDTLAFVAVVLGLTTLVRLPLAFWRSYLHEREWDLSTQTASSWLADAAKAFAVTLVFTWISIGGLIALARSFPSWWPLVAALGAGAFVLVAGFVAPVLLEPLFNRFEPLADAGLADELRSLAAEGVQSLLLEGGPTLAASFLDADLVDKLLVFTAPVLAGGNGPTFLPRLGSGGASTHRVLSHLSARAVGEDVLLEAYVHEP